MILQTAQEPWKTLSQASASAAAGVSDDVNTYGIAYGGTLTRPSIAAGPLHFSANGVRLRFALSSAADKQAQLTLWGWDTNGDPLNLLVANLTAGTAACGATPDIGSTLTDFYYADTVIVTSDHCQHYSLGTNGGNGIVEVGFDLRGLSCLFADFDCDAVNAGVTDATDAICFYKVY